MGVEDLHPAERELVMTVAGGALENLCIDDEVRYVEKYWRTKTAELSDSEIMTVVKTDGLTD